VIRCQQEFKETMGLPLLVGWNFVRYHKYYTSLCPPVCAAGCWEKSVLPKCVPDVEGGGLTLDVDGGVSVRGTCLLGIEDSRLWEAPRMKCLSFVWTLLGILLL